MKLQHRRTRLTKPPQTRAWLLCLFFCCRHFGRFFGAAHREVGRPVGLGSYFSDLALTAQQPADIISVVWASCATLRRRFC